MYNIIIMVNYLLSKKKKKKNLLVYELIYLFAGGGYDHLIKRKEPNLLMKVLSLLSSICTHVMVIPRTYNGKISKAMLIKRKLPLWPQCEASFTGESFVFNRCIT